MKKSFLASAATYIAVLATLNSGFAQKSNQAFVYNSKESPSTSKAATHSELSSTSADAVNAKAMKDFRKSFSGAINVTWFTVPAGFTTKFMQNDIEYRVDYTKKGRWSGTMKSYDEKKLPRDVRATVKSVYYDYSITWIREITVTEYPNVIVYIIHIEDEKSFKNLQVIDGEIYILEAYEKS